ncbi:MAG: hypothetical protein DMG70_07470 [Acidobacteria bacterium]|nr:MAG: hypothetical protein DMG70_07470 [Acidobacteriota bacterium]
MTEVVPANAVDACGRLSRRPNVLRLDVRRPLRLARGQIDEHPYCYTTLYEMITEAATRAKLDGVTWHTLRHTYRSWLDETGAPMTVQQNLMRHSDIRTTMNIYGDALPATLRAANSRVARMALPN